MSQETREKVINTSRALKKNKNIQCLTCPPLFSVPPVGHHGHGPGTLAPTAGAGRGHRVPGAEAGGGGHDGGVRGGGVRGVVQLGSHVSQQSVNFYLTSIRFL